jgi:hypothetical protein
MDIQSPGNPAPVPETAISPDKYIPVVDDSEEAGPSPARAVICLLLNVVVFPGLGTLLSGDRDWRRTGFLQLGFGAGLVPTTVLIGTGAITLQGSDPNVVQAWLSNFMMVLILWNVISSVQIIRGAWKKARAREIAAASATAQPASR